MFAKKVNAIYNNEEFKDFQMWVIQFFCESKYVEFFEGKSRFAEIHLLH